MLMIVLQNVKSNESIRITLDKTNELGMSRLPQLIPREACSDPEKIWPTEKTWNKWEKRSKSNPDLATWALCSQALKSLAASASQNDSSSTTEPPIGQHLSTFVSICQHWSVFGSLGHMTPQLNFTKIPTESPATFSNSTITVCSS